MNLPGLTLAGEIGDDLVPGDPESFGLGINVGVTIANLGWARAPAVAMLCQARSAGFLTKLALAHGWVADWPDDDTAWAMVTFTRRELRPDA